MLRTNFTHNAQKRGANKKRKTKDLIGFKNIANYQYTKAQKEQENAEEKSHETDSVTCAEFISHLG